MFEREPVINATKAKQMVAYKHRSFWQCVDSKRDLERLKEFISKKKLPWLDL